MNSTPDESMVNTNVESDDGSSRSHYAILVAASGLPDEASNLIISTVRQTRLSPGEQACVAEELIAHFADGLEASGSLDDLVKRFGNSRTIATLIRRARHRCCPQPRLTNFAAQTGLLFIFATAMLSSYALMILIAPKMEKAFHFYGAKLPGTWQSTKSINSFLHGYFLWVILLVGMVGLFEWKCRRENKPLIRTVGLVGLSLLSVANVGWLVAVLMTCLLQLMQMAI